MDVPIEYRAQKSSQKRHPKSSKGQKEQQFYPEFDVQSQQQQYTQNFGQSDMFYGGQVYSQTGYGGQMPGGSQFPGQQYLNDPVTNMAVQYGQALAGQGKDLVHQNIQNYVTSSKLKYYFAVDTKYVGKKLGLLFFPYTHSDWSIHYNQDEPVAPRYEVNAPDLYIPVMAFVTYILVAGLVLGIQGRFTPEQLGVQASSALVWLIIELVAFLFSIYVMNLKSSLKYLDIIAYCGYKFVGMTISLLTGLAFNTTAYYGVLLWFCISLVFFLIRNLKVQVVPQQSEDGYNTGAKRSLYLILCVSFAQPLLMWWLTSYVMIYNSTAV
uniref:Protein YIF1 n=2 Tax=Arion vulgaris TaxID=1028688 RepID=A0A0B6ZXJ0_9EUPU